jgi:hypothetical protein
MRTAAQIADEMDQLGKDSERLGKAFVLASTEVEREQLGIMARAASSRWSRLNMDYQLARAVGR